MVLRPELELCSSSLLDEVVLDEPKEELNARSGSSILKNSSDPYYPLVKKFQDVACHIHRLYYLLIEVYVMRLTWFLEPNTALHGSGPYQRSNVTSLTNSFV